MVNFLLQSIADGSFLCVACGNTIYDLRHTCDEMRDQMAKEAAKMLGKTDTITSEKVHENS